MRFTINLATRTYINHRLVNRIFTITSVILVLVLVWSARGIFTGLGEINRLKADISKYESQLSARPDGVSEQDYARMQDNIRFYNNIINRKTSDWIGLLDQLEKATPDGIALTSFVPDPKSREIKIEGEARTFAKVRSYIEKLEESKAFRNIQLQSHQEAAATDKGRTVKFAVSFQAVNQ